VGLSIIHLLFVFLVVALLLGGIAVVLLMVARSNRD
jgi:hypothetical protein